MSVIIKGDILGIIHYDGPDSKVICRDCMTDENWNNLPKEEEAFLMPWDVNKGNILYFCDLCEKQL